VRPKAAQLGCGHTESSLVNSNRIAASVHMCIWHILQIYVCHVTLIDSHEDLGLLLVNQIFDLNLNEQLMCVSP
jgi:hypothetical protein